MADLPEEGDEHFQNLSKIAHLIVRDFFKITHLCILRSNEILKGAHTLSQLLYCKFQSINE